jgi:hypothetical protein
MNVHFWTYNATSGQTFTNATGVSCTYYLIDNKGNNTLRLSSQAGAGGRILYGKGGTYCANFWWGTVKAGNLTTGVYSYQIKCQGLSLGGYDTGYFEVNQIQAPFSSFPFFYLIAILSITFLILAIATSNSFLGFSAGILTLLTGIYTLVYGTDGLTSRTVYTDGIAYVFLGIGIIVLISSAYSAIEGSGVFRRESSDD